MSALLNHSHVDEPFDDFALQPLLPRKLSQMGPGVSWYDVDNDGWDDILVPSGKGGSLAVFRNNQRGGFTRVQDGLYGQPVGRDQTTVLGWAKSPGQSALLAGFSIWENSSTNESCVSEYDLKSKMMVNRLPGSKSSTGPLALADIDRDGDLDLFVGGRVVPGEYPSAANSMLFRNLGGRWELDQKNSRLFEESGLVSGAVFSDVTGDGQPDLLLASEWGSIRLFRNANGFFEEVTNPFGFGSFRGWWNGIATGDFDGDGKLDVVASNWGRNTPYESQRARPLKIYFGDLAGDGSMQMIEAHEETSLGKIVPDRGLDFLAKTMPAIRARYRTYDSYAHASVQEMLGESVGAAKMLEANWLDSTVFLNRGTGFVARPLPIETQFAPAFGVCVADFDGDGNQDIFLAQNFFATQIETPRYDAGFGLWLRGNGGGGFTGVESQAAGVNIYGEQRGAAVCDYDADGRVDLLVGQNAQQTKLFHNKRARPGLRVRLAGPPENPHAVGASLRIVSSERAGPVHEIQAGSGYWSQNSSVEVLSRIGTGEKLKVVWPTGKQIETSVSAATREILVEVNGQVTQR